MGSRTKSKIGVLPIQNGEIPQETAQKESHAVTLSWVKKEMAKPRVAKSAQLRKS